MKDLFQALFFGVFIFTAVSSAHAEDGLNSKKLDDVLAGQKEILQKLDDLKEELQIVKIRATNK